MPAKLSFIEMLEVLTRHRVDFIVVGGVAAILEGTPISTFDLDIVHPRTPENNERLLAALRELNARYKDPAGRVLLPDSSRLETLKTHLLSTDLGPLDVLTIIGENLTYSDLLDNTNEHEIENFQVRALDLRTIIETKEYANRPKDQIALIYLRQTLQLGSEPPHPEEES